ncbi:MAG: response regulator [Chloroflexi bacterium]|nr:response regulator [Chloroflexota bacterium]
MATTKTILVVDDDPEIAHLVAAALEDEGYVTHSLTDGRELIERAQEFQPDLILLDVVMPFVGLDEHLQRLHSNDSTRHIPVLLVTADVRTRTELDRWQGFGVRDCVMKPFDLDVLSDKVKHVLGEE